MTNIEFKVYDTLKKCWSDENILIDKNGTLYLEGKVIEDNRFDIIWFTGTITDSGEKIYENSILEAKSDKTGFKHLFEVRQLNEYIAIQPLNMTGSEIDIVQLENPEEKYYSKVIKNANVISHIYD